MKPALTQEVCKANDKTKKKHKFLFRLVKKVKVCHFHLPSNFLNFPKHLMFYPTIKFE